MKTVPVLIEKTRSWSKTRLLGLAIGGYAAISVALFCFGGALTSASLPRPGNLQAFLFLIPGVFVGFLDFIQIYAPDYFGYVPRERLTKSALWLNAIPILGFFAMLLLKRLIPTGGHLGFLSLVVALLTATSFVLGILLSLVNVFWILIVAKARIALLATVCLCVLPALWPAYRVGIFTRDAGRYATRDNATIYLQPTDVNFEIPRAWLEWNAEFHNNLHLTHRELQSVRFGAGEWDHEYGEVVNAALPFEYCAAHLGGEGWGREGVSFADLQMRAYVADLASDEILSRISGPASATAKELSTGYFNGPGEVKTEVSAAGPWQRSVIRYSVFYGDYGGVANVEFYLRPVSKYQLVLVFMGTNENEKQSILQSVHIPGPPVH
jgi:hypothetical protein